MRNVKDTLPKKQYRLKNDAYFRTSSYSENEQAEKYESIVGLSPERTARINGNKALVLHDTDVFRILEKFTGVLPDVAATDGETLPDTFQARPFLRCFGQSRHIFLT